jgi:hypothetical protein
MHSELSEAHRARAKAALALSLQEARLGRASV